MYNVNMRRNPDERLRALERQAFFGDFSDQLNYLNALIRSGQYDLSDHYSVQGIEQLYMCDPSPPDYYGKVTYYRICSLNELPFLSLAILWALLYDTSPNKPGWLNSHIITAFGRLKQEDLLVEYLVQEIEERDWELTRQEGSDKILNFVIDGIPVPMRDSTRKVLLETLEIPLLQQRTVGKMVKARDPRNIEPLYDLYLRRKTKDSGYTIKIIDAIGRSGVGSGQERAIEILLDALMDTELYGPSRVHAARRLTEILEVDAIPYIEAAMETMQAQYTPEGEWVGWPDSHQYQDLRELLRHIDERFVRGREHCYAAWCAACTEEDRSSTPCQQALAGSYCSYCGSARQLWHL